MKLGNNIVQNMFGVPYPVLALEHLWVLQIVIQKTQNARTYSPYPDNQRCSSAKTGYGTSNMLMNHWIVINNVTPLKKLTTLYNDQQKLGNMKSTLS